MEKSTRHYDIEKAKMYKDLYRPSANISRFLKTLWGIVLLGDSPISGHHQYRVKKSH